MPLTRDRNTPRREGEDFFRQVAADAVIFMGALVALNAAGHAVPASTATGLVADGVAEEPVDNTGGAAGDLNVKVRKGIFRFANSAGGDEITIAHIGDTAYIVDDETVALTDGTSTRSAAGTIVDVDSDGVWIRIA
jgi:hypothetical protein